MDFPRHASQLLSSFAPGSSRYVFDRTGGAGVRADRGLEQPRSTFSADGARRAHALLPFTTRLASLDRRVEGFVRSRGHRVSGRTVDEPVD